MLQVFFFIVKLNLTHNHSFILIIRFIRKNRPCKKQIFKWLCETKNLVNVLIDWKWVMQHKIYQNFYQKKWNATVWDEEFIKLTKRMMKFWILFFCGPFYLILRVCSARLISFDFTNRLISFLLSEICGWKINRVLLLPLHRRKGNDRKRNRREVKLRSTWNGSQNLWNEKKLARDTGSMCREAENLQSLNCDHERKYEIEAIMVRGRI